MTVMVSSRASDSFLVILQRALQRSVADPHGATLSLEPSVAGNQEQYPNTRLVVLTLASFSFRAVLMLEIQASEGARKYLHDSDDLDLIAEHACEIGNLCCGSMNRDLAVTFQHVGLSTPYVLDGRCLQYVASLTPDHQVRYRVLINDEPAFHVRLCINAYQSINFAAAEAVEEQASAGALELF